MAPAVVARGLSALIALADHPSLHPSASIAVESALILYIARVPGSKDVFLTTIKPRQKVVTAQDIESSLYYFHVDGAQDDDLVESTHDEEKEHATGGGMPLTGRQEALPVITRKPVLPARSSNGVERGSLPDHGFHTRNQERHTQQLNVAQNRQQNGLGIYFDQYQPEHGELSIQRSPLNHLVSPPLPPRKLCGPRPPHTRNQLSEIPPGPVARGKENVNPRRWSEQPPTLPPRGGRQEKYEIENIHPPPLPGLPRPSDRSRFDPPFFNPSWSFAEEKAAFINAYAPPVRSNKRHTISSGFTTLQHDGSAAPLSITMIRRDPYSGAQENIGHLTLDRRPPANQSPSALIELLTPGYRCFEEQPEAQANTSQAETLNSESSATATPAFRRHITLKNAKSIRSPKIASFSTRTSIDFSTPSSPLPMQSPFSSKSRLAPLTPPPPPLQTPHSFLSPWHTTCIFTSSAAHPALRLMHTRNGHAISLSELRSNLPSARRKRPLPRPLLAAAMHAQPSREDGNDNDNDDDDDDDDDAVNEARMDLSLGRERAGGGLAGKAAKLGKLVVEPEALRMLDLVVAANVAVWWAAYDRGGG